MLRVERMTFRQREQLAEEVHAQQPNLFFSVLVLQRYDAILEQLEVVLNVLLIFHGAMKGSGKFKEKWLLDIRTEAEKSLVLAALNLVECIAERAPQTAD